MKAPTAETSTPAETGSGTQTSVPTLEQMPDRLVTDEAAILAMKQQIEGLQDSMTQAGTVIRYLCGRLGVSPSSVLEAAAKKN